METLSPPSQPKPLVYVFIRTRREEEELFLVAPEEGQGSRRGAPQAPAGLVLPEGLRTEVLINTSHVSALSSSSPLRSHTAGRFRCQPARRLLIRTAGIFTSRGDPSGFFWCFQLKSQTGSDLSNGETILFSFFFFFIIKLLKINNRCGSDTIPIPWLRLHEQVQLPQTCLLLRVVRRAQRPPRPR